MSNYLMWDKTVQTLDRVISIASRPGHCANPDCSGYPLRLVSAEGQQIALPRSTYGYDVLARIGWLRQEKRCTYNEIEAELGSRIEISPSHVRHLYQQVYLPFLACHERQYWDQLAQVADQDGGLIIALDGLAPEGGEAQLWFIRELLTGLTLRSGWLSQQDQATFEAFLKPLKQLEWPILAVLSDKQRGLVPAVAELLPDSHHQFCQAHYLSNLAEPLSAADSAFKVELQKAVRQQVGTLIRAENAINEPQSGLLTITGLLPDDSSSNEEPQTAESSETAAPPHSLPVDPQRASSLLLGWDRDL